MISGTGHWRLHVNCSPKTNWHIKWAQYFHALIPSGILCCYQCWCYPVKVWTLGKMSLWFAKIPKRQMPFIYSKEYLHYMLLQGNLGDQGICKDMLMLWQMMLTLFNGSCLTQLKIWHNKPLADVNVILIYDRKLCCRCIVWVCWHFWAEIQLLLQANGNNSFMQTA